MWLSRNDECRFYEVHSPNTKEREKKKTHHTHGYRLQEYTVHSLSSTLITVKLLGRNAPASSPPLPEQQALTCTPTSTRSISPITRLLLAHPSSFLAGGIRCFSVPLIPTLDLGRTKSPLRLEARGYSPVNTHPPPLVSSQPYCPLPPSPWVLLHFLFAPGSHLLC